MHRLPSVGGANISNAALIGGLEWTVKFTQAAQADLYVAAQAQFESLWNDPEFELFDPNSEAALRRLRDLVQRFGSDYWHTVVIDECHHLPAQVVRCLCARREAEVPAGADRHAVARGRKAHRRVLRPAARQSENRGQSPKT
jgi:hypothetical protein